MSTNPINYGVRQTPIAERINHMMDKANAPMICSTCGSSFFYKVQAEQFSDGGYGSAAFRSISNATESVYICLCGAVADVKDTTARGVDGRRVSFVATVKEAIVYQKNNSVTRVAEMAASITELNELKARVAWLEESIEILNSEPVPVEDQEVDSEGQPIVTEQGLATDVFNEQLDMNVPPASDPSVVERISTPARTGRPAKKEGV